MKGKKRARVNQPDKPADAERRRKVNAAIRHAEKVVTQTGAYEPVIYRPSSGPTLHPQVRRKKETSAVVRPDNPAMEEALRKALALPDKPSPAPDGPSQAKSGRQQIKANIPDRTPDSSSEGLKAHSGNKTRPVVARPKKLMVLGPEYFYPPNNMTKTARKNEPKSSSIPSKEAASKAENKAGKQPKKTKKKTPKPISNKAAKEAAVKIQRLRSERIRLENHTRLQAKEAIDISRRALNVRLREKRDAMEAGLAACDSPFHKLQREWHAAFKILLHYEDEDPSARNVVAARQRLATIEAEWDRRHTLKPGDPDYFPWPSTDISTAISKGAKFERNEVGMLSYLGYHVGLGSLLTGAQRVRLLGQIYSMRLPPLIGLEYMREWGQPDTGTRLRKMAESLASFVKTSKRRNLASFDMAIGHWEADLLHLRRHYYDECFDFIWPNS